MINDMRDKEDIFIGDSGIDMLTAKNGNIKKMANFQRRNIRAC